MIARKPKSSPPERVIEVGKTIGLLRKTIERKPISDLPASLREQTIGTVRHWINMRGKGQSVIYPGLAKFAAWGKCKERQARENLRTLEYLGVIRSVAYAKGGRRATRFIVSGEGLYRVMAQMGLNPSKQLRVRLTAFDLPRPAPMRTQNPAEYPAENPAVSAAGIQSLNGNTDITSNIMPFPSSTGRRPSGLLSNFSAKNICREEPRSESSGARAKKRTPDFASFLGAYPLKTNVDGARTAFQRALDKGAKADEIIAGARAYATSVRGNDPQWTAAPTSWLKGERWNDEYPQELPEEKPKHVIGSPEDLAERRKRLGPQFGEVVR